MGSFDERMAELSDLVGDGNLVGTVNCNQYYAVYVHEILRNRHPVGQAKFLETALHAEGPGILERVGQACLELGGREAMVEGVQKLADASAERTPIEFDNLRRSYNRSATDNGARYYFAPQEAAPLSRQHHRHLRRHNHLPGKPAGSGHGPRSVHLPPGVPPGGRPGRAAGR